MYLNGRASLKTNQNLQWSNANCSRTIYCNCRKRKGRISLDIYCVIPFHSRLNGDFPSLRLSLRGKLSTEAQLQLIGGSSIQTLRVRVKAGREILPRYHSLGKLAGPAGSHIFTAAQVDILRKQGIKTTSH